MTTNSQNYKEPTEAEHIQQMFTSVADALTQMSKAIEHADEPPMFVYGASIWSVIMSAFPYDLVQTGALETFTQGFVTAVAMTGQGPAANYANFLGQLVETLDMMIEHDRFISADQLAEVRAQNPQLADVIEQYNPEPKNDTDLMTGGV